MLTLRKMIDHSHCSQRTAYSSFLIHADKRFSFQVNIGNIHFKRKEYNKAIKMYRMALDQIPAVQKTLR